jgi:hypothetical protein
MRIFKAKKSPSARTAGHRWLIVKRDIHHSNEAANLARCDARYHSTFRPLSPSFDCSDRLKCARDIAGGQAC